MDECSIVNALLDFAKHRSSSKEEEEIFTPNPDARKLIFFDPNAFLVAVLLDERFTAEIVWEGPYKLKQRLGHLDPARIAEMEESKLARVCAEKPAIHREYNKAAKRIRDACILLNRKYEGNAENIWKDNPRTDDLANRFREFNGIGQKKSSMAVNILVRDIGVPARDKRWIDVSDDIQVRRVFQRAGIIKEYSQQTLIEAARRLNPEYPGALDLPCWIIGRQFCHVDNPECHACPLEKHCPKIFK